ncbi:MAG: alpha/beta fold hydrolase [Chloroflexi bacterium]|nr:alpha/beta fold hydrolase [Chloroflexota bacterium]
MSDAGYADIEGVRVGGRVVGSGPPLLLLHGLGGSGAEWRATIPALAQHFKVYAPTMPGHGDSGPIPEYSLESAHRLFQAFLLSEGLEKVILAGQSMGGLVALDLALTFPARVSKLVLVNSAGLGSEVNWGLRLLTLPILGEIVCDFLWPRLRTRLAKLAKYLGLKVPEVMLEEGAWKLQGSLARLLRTGIDLRGQKLWPTIRDRLPNLKVPTLIIWGERDELFPLSQAVAAHKIVPRSRLHVLRGAGHVPSREHIAELNAVVLEFLLSESGQH